MKINFSAIVSLSASQRRGWTACAVVCALAAGILYRNHSVSLRPEKPASISCTDINTAGEAELEALPGIGEKLAARIVKYRSNIGGFQFPADLMKVYGIDGDRYAGLAGFVSVSEVSAQSKPQRNYTAKRKDFSRKENAAYADIEYSDSTRASGGYTRKKNQQPATVDINSADSLQLLTLPGIGMKTAGRIVRYREALGFFHSVEQVAEVWGISPENFERMKPFLVAGDSRREKIQINATDKQELSRHPYIDFTSAKIIVAYREMHGEFKSIEDLKQVNVLDAQMIEKIAPYLSFTEKAFAAAK